MRRRTLLTVGNEGIKASEAVAGDICLCNKTTEKLLIVEAVKFSTTDYPSTAYSPVGVVVIPGSHDVYGDGSCGVISIKSMNCDTPDTGGTSEQKMYFGVYETDISTLPNLNRAPYVGTGTLVGDNSSTIIGIIACPHLPSDKFSTVQCPHDTDTYYYYNNFDYYQAPSPFLTDGTRNPAYYQTSSPSSTSNCLADFDGVGNTEILTGLATAQSDWKTASTITNNSGAGYYPAACCCWRYHTDGTKQGDWYLPAMGELGYIMPNFNKINTTIYTLINSYSVGVQLYTSNVYWSSTECNIYSIRTLHKSDGYVGYIDKNTKLSVCAFLRVK